MEEGYLENSVLAESVSFMGADLGNLVVFSDRGSPSQGFLRQAQRPMVGKVNGGTDGTIRSLPSDPCIGLPGE